MTEYSYTGHPASPDLLKLREDIAASAMAGKNNYSGARWDEDAATIKTYWSAPLTEGDKAILDTLVAGV